MMWRFGLHLAGLLLCVGSLSAADDGEPFIAPEETNPQEAMRRVSRLMRRLSAPDITTEDRAILQAAVEDRLSRTILALQKMIEVDAQSSGSGSGKPKPKNQKKPEQANGKKRLTQKQTSKGGERKPGGKEPGKSPGGEKPGGDKPGGDQPGGEKPGGKEPGKSPGGDQPGGDQPGGKEPGSTPGGEEPGAPGGPGEGPGGESGTSETGGSTAPADPKIKARDNVKADGERWGNLPPKLRDDLELNLGRDVPEGLEEAMRSFLERLKELE